MGQRIGVGAHHVLGEHLDEGIALRFGGLFNLVAKHLVGGEAVVHIGQQLFADDHPQVIRIALHLGLIGFQAGKGLLGSLIHQRVGVGGIDCGLGRQGKEHAGHQTQQQGDFLEHDYSFLLSDLLSEDWL